MILVLLGYPDDGMEVSMKFITEEDLRDLYRKKPFTGFDLEPGTRLTPGARQFLMDKGINMADRDFCNKEKNEAENQSAQEIEKKDTCKSKKLYYRMKSVEAMFLLTEQELLSRDVCLAQSVIKLSKQFGSIKKYIKSNTPVENLSCHECTGIKNCNFSEDLDDCFEVTEFHIQLEKGREIVALHRLRCELYDLVPMVTELLGGREEEKGICEDITAKVYQIINSLSQLICHAFGGKKCQREV